MDNKEKYLKKKIKYFPEYSKIVYFRNPKEFIKLYIESVNPNHVSIIWGKLKRKYRKHRSSNFMKVGKIIIPLLCICNFKLDFIIDILMQSLDEIIISYIIIEFYLLIIKMDGILKCLLELRAVLGREKLLNW